MAVLDDAAVLTGDLVDSSLADLSTTEQAMTDLAESALHICGWVNSDTHFTRFRGDGWQIMMQNRPELALRAAVYLIARQKARKGGLLTRVAMAMGSVEHQGTHDLSDARGEAFTGSGRLLDAMKPDLLHGVFRGIRPIHQGFLDLLEPFLWRWTPEQAEAISYALPPMGISQKEIAARLDISDQAVSYRLKGAHAHAIQSALVSWEADFGWKPAP